MFILGSLAHFATVNRGPHVAKLLPVTREGEYFSVFNVFFAMVNRRYRAAEPLDCVYLVP